MTQITLAMTESCHEELMDYLFPGDGLEAAAVLICNHGTGRLTGRLLVADMRCPPYEECQRQRDRVLWPFADTVTPRLISEVDQNGQSLVTIHSHPEGEARFSLIDDKNDKSLLTSVGSWFDDGRRHGTAVARADGMIRARTLNPQGEFELIDTVMVVGNGIRCWKTSEAAAAERQERRLAQTFGRGTLQLLKGLRVGVVGCSGTGSIVAELLARYAVGELVIVDDDVVEEVNLNRILNGMEEDAKRGRAKAVVAKEAIERMGLGTVVHACVGRTESREILRALVDCDVVFGCVDTAYGRYHLECLATAYLIPYFDLGVDLDADEEGGILAADAVAHYVRPDGSNLLGRGAYTMDQVTAELWRRADPGHYGAQRAAGYLAEVGEDRPAVMSVNMQAACLAFNDFLARITGFRLDDNEEYTMQRLRLVHGSFEVDAAKGGPHELFGRYMGTGDASLLVRNNCTDA